MEGTKVNRGITRRTFSELFDIIVDRSGTCSYELSISIVEIYNESIRDLLAKRGPNVVELRESSSGQVLPQNLTVTKVKSYEKIE